MEHLVPVFRSTFVPIDGSSKKFTQAYDRALSVTFGESCQEAATASLQLPPRPEHHPPVGPHYEHRKEDQC
jgi:hypothetical protein